MCVRCSPSKSSSNRTDPREPLVLGRSMVVESSNSPHSDQVKRLSSCALSVIQESSSGVAGMVFSFSALCYRLSSGEYASQHESQPKRIIVLKQLVNRLGRMGVSRNGRANPLRCPVPAIWPLLLIATAMSRVQPESAGMNSSSLTIVPSLHSTARV